MGEFDCPSYNQDIQDREGFPAGAERFRQRLEAKDAFVMFSLTQTHKAFEGQGQIANSKLQERFDNNSVNFIDQVEASKHYPCVKRAWVKHLGELPEPAIDRVE